MPIGKKNAIWNEIKILHVLTNKIKISQMIQFHSNNKSWI